MENNFSKTIEAETESTEDVEELLYTLCSIESLGCRGGSDFLT